MTVNIHAILKQLRETATSTRDLGDKFEQLIVQYLQTDPHKSGDDRVSRSSPIRVSVFLNILLYPSV